MDAKEAAFLADLCDRIGDYHTANLIDEYIVKMAESNGDLIKQAGLFRNLIKKLVGFGKRVFFKVYRELYSKAVEAQTRLDARVAEINKAQSDIKKDLKYHDLEGWRGGIYALNLSDAKEIMGDFDMAYGKLIQYLGLTGESEKGEVPSETEEKSQIGKLPDFSGGESATESERKRMTPGAEKGWVEMARTLSFNPTQGSIRFDKTYFNYLLGKHITTDGAGNVRYWSSYSEQKQPMNGKLKDLMGDDEWDMKEDKNFVYLYPKTRGTDIGAPPVQRKEVEEDLGFENPEIPKPSAQMEKHIEKAPVTPVEQKEVPQENAGTEGKLEEVIEKPEEVTEEKSPVAELVQKQSPRKAVWVEIARPHRQKDGELWTRFTKVYPVTAQKYERSGRGKVLEDPSVTFFLDQAIPKQFPGHSANVSKVWLPTDLDRRKEYIALAQKNWAEEDKKKKAEKIKELYKISMREKWLK